MIEQISHNNTAEFIEKKRTGGYPTTNWRKKVFFKNSEDRFLLSHFFVIR